MFITEPVTITVSSTFIGYFLQILMAALAGFAAGVGWRLSGKVISTATNVAVTGNVTTEPPVTTPTPNTVK